MSTATLPAVASNGPPHRYPIDHDAVLKAVGINIRDPNAQALLLTCERYSLDPILRHMVLIEGRPYITRDGLLHVAHASGQLDGIEVVEETETETHYKAKVAVYRKDMTKRFAYTGRFPKMRWTWQGQGGNRKRVQEPHPYGPEMAVKCGECMSLRRAFDVALCAREEMWDRDDEPGPQTIDIEPSGDHGRRTVNEDFQPRRPRAVPEPPQEDTPPPSRMSWAAFIADRADEARKHWATEMTIAEVDPVMRDHPDFKMPNKHETTQHFINHAISTGTIKEADIAKADRPDKRDPEKAKAAMEDLFRRAPKRIRAAVDSYFVEKERSMRIRLGMDDADDGGIVDDRSQVAAGEESQEPAEAREPGEDG